MKLPELPTDNLYKFVALAGITLVLAAMLPFYYAHLQSMEAIKARGEFDGIERRLGVLRRQILAWGEREQETTQNARGDGVQDVDSEQARLLEDNAELMREVIELDTRARLNRYLSRVRLCGIAAGFLLLLVGGAMAWRGFYLWYERLQRPLDEILAKQCAREKRALEKLENGDASVEAVPDDGEKAGAEKSAMGVGEGEKARAAG